MSPATWDELLEVAAQRAADADAIQRGNTSGVGSVYMAGYAIECSLKAYLNLIGRQYPSSGRSGHDLRGLWSESGFKLRDLNDEDGSKSFFISQWSTDLRYETSLPTDLSPDRLIAAAKLMKGWIHTRMKRHRSRRKRRARAS